MIGPAADDKIEERGQAMRLGYRRRKTGAQAAERWGHGGRGRGGNWGDRGYRRGDFVSLRNRV